MTAADQFWAATEPAAPEASTVIHLYRFSPEEFAARLGIALPDGAKITEVENRQPWTDGTGCPVEGWLKITVENKLERKP